MIFEFFVEGQPVTQPRERFRTLLPRMDQLARAPRGARSLYGWLQKNCRAIPSGIPKEHGVHAWKSVVLADFRLHYRNSKPMEGAIFVSIVFAMPRPKSKTRKTIANWRYWHEQTPDIDNLEKAVLDALKGFAWLDDCQVCVNKSFAFVCGDGDRSGCAIRIEQAPESVATWADSLIRTGLRQASLL